MSELMTKPQANGDSPLPRRQPRGLLPSSWTGRSAKIEYADSAGKAAKTTAALSEMYAFGPILRASSGERMALSWDRIALIELIED